MCVCVCVHICIFGESGVEWEMGSVHVPVSESVWVVYGIKVWFSKVFSLCDFLPVHRRRGACGNHQRAQLCGISQEGTHHVYRHTPVIANTHPGGHTHTHAGKPEIAVNLFSAFSHPGLSFLPPGPPRSSGQLVAPGDQVKWTVHLWSGMDMCSVILHVF